MMHRKASRIGVLCLVAGLGLAGCKAGTVLLVNVAGSVAAPIASLAVTVNQGGIERPLSFDGDGSPISLPTSFTVTVRGADGTSVEVCIDALDTTGVIAARGCDSRGITPGEVNTFNVTLLMVAAGCGNDMLDPGEDCDGADLGGADCASVSTLFTGGTLACSATCSFDTTACELPDTCGNGNLDTGEDCDGGNLGVADCVSLGHTGGALACGAACAYDESGCFDCGNNSVEPGEQCDGSDLAGATCSSIGMGFDGGTLACNGTCAFDTSACTAPVTCGDGTIDPGIGEDCEPGNLGGATCASEGFGGGMLTCTAGCVFNTSGCATCGNNMLEMGEECDGSALGGFTCGSLGFSGGTLSCDSNCMFDTGACTQCGNNNIEPGETCDGSDLAGFDCGSFGFTSGTLGCSVDCGSFDQSACFNQVCTPGQPYCDPDGRTRHVCNAMGTGPDPAQDLLCEFICEMDECLYVSNVDPMLVNSCGPTAPAFNPAMGEVVNIQEVGGGVQMTCLNDCGGGANNIFADFQYVAQPLGGVPLAIFCFSSITIDPSVTIGSSSGPVSAAIVWISDGDVILDGTVNLDGWDGMPGGIGGVGGPGGFAGADTNQAGGDGFPGMGPGGGEGGFASPLIGGASGAGGGSFSGIGGTGGSAGFGAPGGLGGPPYGSPDIIPFWGGSGGGSGANDGGGGGNWRAAGGGGGALHIIARGIVTLAGTLSARGGDGRVGGSGGNAGGGGGSGGAFLLEARTMNAFGFVTVDGGMGGSNSSCAPGGMGASGPMIDGEDGFPGGGGCGGGGGGGGGGRVRYNFPGGGIACAGESPSGSCSEGPLLTTWP